MIRNAFCMLVALVWSAVCFPIGFVFAIFSSQENSLWVPRKLWSPVLLWASGAQLKVMGGEHVEAGKPYVFVSNHQSTIDIPAIFAALPQNTRYIAKKSLASVPFVGWYILVAGFVLVDRTNRQRAIASLRTAAQQIHAGTSIIAFAEGTRSATREVMPFKSGPFALAIQADVPVVPVTIEGSGKLMPKNSWKIAPGPIRIVIGKPIHPSEVGHDREALRNAAHRTICETSVALGGLGSGAATPAMQATA